MKRSLFCLRLLFIFIFIPFIFSCESEQESTVGPPKVSNIKHTDCKTFKSLVSEKQDCIEYHTTEGNYLKINRINVAFNCCIDDVNIKANIDPNRVITIIETEVFTTPCNCNCLYDLEYTIGPLEFGIYTLRIVEQYADTMTIEIPFSATTQGEYCEERDGYPWNVD